MENIRVSVQGARISHISLVHREVSVGIVFRIFNASDRALTLNGIYFKVFNEKGEEIADGKLEGKSALNPHSSHYVISEVKMPVVWFFAKSLLDLRDRGASTLNIKGKLEIDGSPVKFETVWKIGD